ncbi:MAG: hypothetical protein H0U75_09195 [Legionella sp.]|nr:hypothetical protein [Legionella sp.]
MSRTSCISHPEGERLILIRKWQLEACSQDACAAALLNLFEYWHNIKLEQKSQSKGYNKVAGRHGENSTQIETLLQWHKSQQLEVSLLNIFNKRRIQAAIELLENLKFISVHRNPNPRYAFDKTRHFLFHPNVVTLWLKEYSAKNDLSIAQDECTDGDNLHLSIETNCAYGDYKNEQPSTQFASIIDANLPQQYTENTYQDDLPKLPNKTHTVACKDFSFPSSLFDLFWKKWIVITQKSLNKRKSFEIFSTLVNDDNESFLHKMLGALEMQAKEKVLRQKFNLFIPQWPNPSSWLKEARWEDDVCLDEAFYRTEQLRNHASPKQHKQIIKQQREGYLDDQYQSSKIPPYFITKKVDKLLKKN